MAVYFIRFRKILRLRPVIRPEREPAAILCTSKKAGRLGLVVESIEVYEGVGVVD